MRMENRNAISQAPFNAVAVFSMALRVACVLLVLVHAAGVAAAPASASSAGSSASHLSEAGGSKGGATRGAGGGAGTYRVQSYNLRVAGLGDALKSAPRNAPLSVTSHVEGTNAQQTNVKMGELAGYSWCAHTPRPPVFLTAPRE